MTLDIATRRSAAEPERQVLDPCYTCGHPRSSHPDTGYWVCSTAVSMRPDVETAAREACLCEGYIPDDGRGRWALDGSRVIQS